MAARPERHNCDCGGLGRREGVEAARQDFKNQQGSGSFILDVSKIAQKSQHFQIGRALGALVCELGKLKFGFIWKKSVCLLSGNVGSPNYASKKVGPNCRGQILKGRLGEAWTRRKVMDVIIGFKHFRNPGNQEHLGFNFL